MKPNSDNLRPLLGLAYDIEGLLLLMAEREDAPADLLTRLDEKIEALQAGVAEIEIKAPAPIPSPSAPVQAPEAIAEAAEEEEEAEADEPAETPTETPAETLDERLARERARDIFKAFTLNDRFRYLRGLFHGSEQEFNDTLGIISGMADFSEAEEYFYDDLCWDPADEDVKAFMDTVKRHF